MTASESKQKVLEVYPDAVCVSWMDGAKGISTDMAEEYLGWGQVTASRDHTQAEDAAWIDAASRLPAPKPVEPAQVESGDGLPPIEITKEDLGLAAHYRCEPKRLLVKEHPAYHTRERQLKASLQREKDLEKLLLECAHEFSQIGYCATLQGRIEAAVTGE